MLLCYGIRSLFEFGKQPISPFLRLGLRPFFLVKLIVRAGFFSLIRLIVYYKVYFIISLIKEFSSLSCCLCAQVFYYVFLFYLGYFLFCAFCISYCKVYWDHVTGDFALNLTYWGMFIKLILYFASFWTVNITLFSLLWLFIWRSHVELLKCTL